MNANTLGYFWAHNPLTSDDNIFYAVDAEGISVAGKVVEGLSAIDMSGIDVTGMNQFNYSTGEDNIDPNAETGAKDYGWNGDVMGLMFDPLGALIAEGFAGQADYSAWYLVGLFEGDVAKIYRSHTPNNEKNGDITAKAGVQAAGKKLDDGWCFEIKLPWDMILSDINDASMGYVNLTKEDVLKRSGNIIRAGAFYHDRYYDEEQGRVATWGSYFVTPEYLPDGTPGYTGPAGNIGSYGITLKIATTEPLRDVDLGSWYFSAVYYCYENYYMEAYDIWDCNQYCFYPGMQLTRADFVVIIARVFNADLSKYTDNSFIDVDKESDYAAAVAWAKDMGYMLGIGNGRFGVNNVITREEAATVFYRIHNSPAVDAENTLNIYTDNKDISDWAKDACAWAINEGIFKSVDKFNLTMAPHMLITRAQMAQMIMNYKTK